MMIFNAEIVCPKCRIKNLEFVSTPDSRDRDWCHFACADCGYQLTFADVGRQAVAQSAEMMGGQQENKIGRRQFSGRATTISCGSPFFNGEWRISEADPQQAPPG